MALVLTHTAQAAEPAEQSVRTFPPRYFAALQPRTALDMVGRLPGFTYFGGSGDRGLAGTAGNVLIDGQRPASKQNSLSDILDRIPAATVDHIDVVKGGAPGVDMQGYTIIANVVLSQKPSRTGAITVVEQDRLADGQQLPQIKLEGASRTKDRDLEGSLTYVVNQDDQVGPGPHDQITGDGQDIYAAHLNAKAAETITTGTGAYEKALAGGSLRLNAVASSEYYLDREADTVLYPLGDDNQYRFAQMQQQGEFSQHYSRAFGARTSFEAIGLEHIQHQVQDSSYLFPGDDEYLSSAYTLTETTAQATLRFQKTSRLALQTSLEGAGNTQNTHNFYRVNGQYQLLPAADSRIKELRGELAILSTWSPTPAYTLEAGLRLEGSTISVSNLDRRGFFYPKPRVVLTWSPTAADQIRLRFERAVDQLDFAAFAATGALNGGGVRAGNSGLLPQDSLVYEAAYERTFWRTGDATLTLRHSAIRDVVDLIAAPPVAGVVYPQSGNIGSASQDDIVFDLTLPLDRLGLANGLIKTTDTWSISSVTDPTTGQPRQITDINPFIGSLSFTQDLPRLASTWGVTVNGPKFWAEYQFDQVERFHTTADISLSYDYKRGRFDLRLEANNLAGSHFHTRLETWDASRTAQPRPDLTDLWDEQISPRLLVSLRYAMP